jgi:NAD(P)H-nitrite reductase large subunit
MITYGHKIWFKEMMKMAATDLLDKSAVLQRDIETYAILPHMPGGLVTPDALRRIADVAEKYNTQALKLTSAQRLAIVGLKEEDLDNAWRDLDMKPVMPKDNSNCAWEQAKQKGLC